METKIEGHCACQPTTNRPAALGFVYEGSEEGEHGCVLAAGWLHASTTCQRFLFHPYAAMMVAAVFSEKGRDREAAGSWMLWNLSVGT